MSPANTSFAQQRARRKRPGRSARHPFKLHPVDLATWDDGNWACPVFWECFPEDIDEPWPYRFESKDKVWIRACDGEWYQGKVVGQARKGKTRFADGLWWFVEFRLGRVNIRKWVAPLNGDVKPDMKHTRKLMSNAGRIHSDSDDYKIV